MNKKLNFKGLGQKGNGVWAATIIGLVLLASAITAYNVDTLYMGSQGSQNLVLASSGTFEAGEENSFFVGLHSAGGEPIMDDLQILLKTGDVERLIFSGKTDSQGLCRVSFTAPENAGTATLVISSGQKTLEQAVTIAARSSARPATGMKFVITTDKPVYQPGQVIHMRGLAINEPGGAYQGSVLLEILTPEGDKIVREEMDTNEYGVVFYDLPLGNSLPLGQYTIRFNVNNNTWEKKVVVDRYVLPRFDMKLEGLQSWYPSDQDIVLGLNVEYFFGKPVDGTLRVKTDIYAATGYYDDWDGVWVGDGWGEAMPFPEDERAAFEPQTATDIAIAPPSYYSTSTWTNINYQTLDIVDGYVEITIPALENVMDEYSYGYWGTHALRMNMTVTDTAYHVESKIYSSIVSTTPIIISVLGDTSVPGAPSLYNILAQRPDGQPIPGAMVDLGGGVASATTDIWGLATIEYEYKGQNSLLLRVESGDDDASVSLPVAAWLNEIKIVADSPFYEMGDNARFTIYDTYGWGRVYWEARGARGTIAVGSISIEDGIGTLDLTITPEMSPYIDMWVYRTGYDIAGDSLLVTVKPTGGLKVDITTPQAIYRPGERVDISFSVTNMQGHMPGVIGLSVIDRAVLELGDRYLGLEGIFFEDAYNGGDYRIMFSSYLGEPDYVYLPPVGGGSEYRDSSAIMSVGLSQTHNNDLAAAANLRSDAIQVFWILMAAVALAGLLIYVSIHGKNVGRGKMLGAFFLLAAFASVAILGSFVMVQNVGTRDTYTDRMAGDEAASPTPAAMDGAGDILPAPPGENRLWDDSAAAPIFFGETGAMMPTNGSQSSQTRTRT
ncbi:MAG: MG2 domain-containing protein, partial [Candidatus Thermoplasmatota archaeon]|nr:MG2 domain-containing protein [Candidatus Thermoplasmatota archaeon]